jgi:ferritin-like metal-binding protein YciE
MTTITNFEDLFVDMLQDIYYAEQKILKALPKMAKSLEEGSALAEAFNKHRDQTEGQVKRLEQVFKLVGQAPKAKKCDALEGLATEADELMEEVECKATLAAGLLAGAQAVEHYEMARYGTLVEWAKVLGHHDVVKLLQETLDEEKSTDQILNKMAISAINKAAFEAQQKRKGETHGHSPKRQAA